MMNYTNIVKNMMLIKYLKTLMASLIQPKKELLEQNYQQKKLTKVKAVSSLEFNLCALLAQRIVAQNQLVASFR